MRFLFSTLSVLVLSVSSSAIAQTLPPEDVKDVAQIMERVAEAYNVERLKEARTIRIESDRRNEYPSHDYGPEFHDLVPQRRHIIMDINNQAGSSEYLTFIGLANYHGRSIVQDGRSIFIDYGSDMYEDLGETDFMSEFGGAIRVSDSLLALYMTKAEETAEYVGSEMWLGAAHDKISFEFPGLTPVTLYVEDGTHHISKMTRQVSPETVVTYTFDNHAADKGLVYAKETSVFINREPLFFSFNGKVSINNRADRAFNRVDKHITQEPERLDQSQMTVESMSPRASHVGQEGSYSTFVETDRGLLAIGTKAGFAERLAAYRAQTGSDRALTYAITMDHHAEELEGIFEAVNAGAVIVSTPDAKGAIEAIFEDNNLSANLETVENQREIAGLSLYTVPTTHASQVIFAVEQDDAFVYQAGHYISPYVDQGFYAKHSAVSLMDAFKQRGVKADKVLSSAGRKAEPWSDFVHAVETYDPTPCFRIRPICQNL